MLQRSEFAFPLSCWLFEFFTKLDWCGNEWITLVALEASRKLVEVVLVHEVHSHGSSSLHNHRNGGWFGVDDTGALKFGKLNDEESSLYDIPAAIVIGVVCGLLGSFFIFVNINLGIVRKKYINTNWKKITEALVFAFLSASIFFGVVAARKNNCKIDASAEEAEENNHFKFRCPEG